MKHAIIGAGNLGLDLAEYLRSEGEQTRMISRSTGYDLMKQFPICSDEDVIWCCVGAGSVVNAKEDFRPFARLHIELPAYLLQNSRPDQKVVLFSSDYCEQPRLSLYAESKLVMERIAEHFDNSYVYRVSSLYGEKKPLLSFPGKIVQRILSGERLSFTTNEVAPTPTKWLAKKAWNAVQNDVRSDCLFPSTVMPAYAWGAMVARTLKDYRIFSPDVDPDMNLDAERPSKIIGRMRKIPLEGLSHCASERLWAEYGPNVVLSALSTLEAV